MLTLIINKIVMIWMPRWFLIGFLNVNLEVQFLRVLGRLFHMGLLVQITFFLVIFVSLKAAY